MGASVAKIQNRDRESDYGSRNGNEYNILRFCLPGDHGQTRNRGNTEQCLFTHNAPELDALNKLVQAEASDDLFCGLWHGNL